MGKRKAKWKRRSVHLSPPQLLLAIFLFFIFLGALLLKLPFASSTSVSWLDALFTSTSAMTVTGLVVVDTGTVFTTFGEVVIMVLIQVGGLGIMSFAVLIYLMLGRRIGFRERLIIQQSLNQTSVGGVIRLVKHLLIFSFAVEGIALILLASEWIPQYGWKQGLYYSLFHSISAFNNAGFSLWADGLVRYVANPLVNIVISALFIIGGIGFTVLMDLWYSKKFENLSLHTKLMLIGTLVINVVAMFVIFFLEYNNPRTLANLSTMGKVLGAYFQAVSPRTAGFNSVDIAGLEDSTIIFMILLMFIGAGSGSTGGGIKLTTFLIITLTVFSFLRQRKEIHVFRRKIDSAYIYKSLAISMTSVVLIFSSMFLLTITEKNAPFIQILFEVVSAFGTVGLTMGLTFNLTALGKCILIFVMFVGKLGPLTLAFSLARAGSAKVSYPKEDLLTG